MALSVLKDLRKVIASLSAADILAASQRPLNIGLAASDPAVREAMEDFLVPAWLDDRTSLRALHSIHPVEEATGDFDIVLCEPGIAVPRNGYLFEPTDPAPVLVPIVREHPELELALARTFPVFRHPVAAGMIHRVSRENALFALVTALPNIIPSLIELPWVAGEFATDTAFITMNQIRMALMMAAAHGQDPGYGQQKIELLSIAGGAFGWRAIARELVGKIPLGGGLIPKAAIAFAGTWIVGLGLEKYHRTGSGLSRREKNAAWETAITEGREVATHIQANLK